MLAPFNEYFFVETDNPDPYSFRFADKSTKYSESGGSIYKLGKTFADINYEDITTARVSGGYIFQSRYTDGGEIILQTRNGSGSRYNDTNVKLSLPALVDVTDYLIDTYAEGTDFWDRLDGVDKNIRNIALYNASYVRGELEGTGGYWRLGNSPYKDQLFYIHTPYVRLDNQDLFAAEIFPYFLTSIGMPTTFANVATRLDSSSSYVWNSDRHAYVNITYKGETRAYGGQGHGEGQGINISDIKQYFTFGKNGTKITLDGIRQLLNDYSTVKVEDDVPRKNALTWRSVYDTVGSGSWVKIANATGSNDAYAYFFQKYDGSFFDTEVMSTSKNGSEIYWGGHIGYASDTWVDGRYVNSYEIYVKGEKFEDHQTSDFILTDFTVPQIKYTIDEVRYNEDLKQYEPIYKILDITESKKTAKFSYISSQNRWNPDNCIFESGCASLDGIIELVKGGYLDEKYLDMVTFTLDEVKELNLDRNTNTPPTDFYYYDGSRPSGTKSNG